MCFLKKGNYKSQPMHKLVVVGICWDTQGMLHRTGPKKELQLLGIPYIWRGFRPPKLLGPACGSLKYAILERKMANFGP